MAWYGWILLAAVLALGCWLGTLSHPAGKGKCIGCGKCGQGGGCVLYPPKKKKEERS